MEAIAVCLFGMESTVSYELKKLGYKISSVTDGRVTFETDGLGVARANISLRCAERILVKAGMFKATSFDELFENVKQIPFEQYIQKDSKFNVTKVRSINSKLVSQKDTQTIVKKAIVSRLQKLYNTTWFEETGGEHNVHIFINKDMVELTFDTTGPALHKRGYRELSGVAPIRETIAAYMVMATPWKNDRIFVDPMCGSGTIAIEAAMYGDNIMPGVNRNFDGESLSFIKPEAWKQARKEAIEGEYNKDFKIMAYDSDPAMILLAKENAATAGVDHLIDFKLQDIKDLDTQKEYGFIVTNPPYGERLGEKEEVEDLYRLMGKVFKKMPTWNIYLISTHEETEQLLGMKATKKQKIYNGKLKSNFFMFPGPKPPRNNK